ncbi:hypothetical protein [Marispirochaeta sp.]|jgi:hypothetical protein|uniref:hypothetical protein n=1 Tax=Marispirochaeta sp. TaxID=2038653 RepID=UPI0029C6783B|nr:hypothetical protein [Marispirochaeta sp.]
MEERIDLDDALNQAVVERREYIDKRLMPKLKESFRHYHTSFQNVYNVLLRKGLIQEDPYRNDFKISEVITPSNEPYLESEKMEKMSIRLSQFDSILEFLTNYYQFSADFLNLKRLKGISSLLNYFHWTKLGIGSTSLNTRVMADLVQHIKQGSDSLSANIVSDGCNQLSKLTSEIFSLLKEVTAFSRQLYKQDIRERVLYKLSISSEPSNQAMDDAYNQIKRSFPRELPDMPFFPELVHELVAEAYSPQRDKLKQELINSLHIKEKKQEKKQDVSFKPLLLEAARILSGASIHMEKAIAKLNESQIMLDQRRLTIGERFRRWVMNVVQKKSEKHVYMVEFFDEKTGATRMIRIDYDAFSENVLKRARALSMLSSKVSSAYMRLEGSEEEKIYEYVSSIVDELHKMLNTLPALDTFFKSETPREMRGGIRGIKLEISAIKNVVIRSNQKRHEYIAKKEEIEQLKKLGIDTSVD